MSAPTQKSQEELKERVKRFYTQLTVGCGNQFCTNPNCKSYFSSADATSPLTHLDPNSAAALALQLATDVKRPKLCDPVIDLPELERLCASFPGSKTVMIRRIGQVFGDPYLLAGSFSAENSGLTCEPAKAAFAMLQKLNDADVNRVVPDSLIRMIGSLGYLPHHIVDAAGPRLVARVFAIVAEHPAAWDSFEASLGQGSSLMEKLGEWCGKYLAVDQEKLITQIWLKEWEPERLRFCVLAVQTAISLHCISLKDKAAAIGPNARYQANRDTIVQKLVLLLNTLRHAFDLFKKPVDGLRMTEWQNPVLCESLNEVDDFICWRNPEEAGSVYTYCAFPWLLDVAYKASLMKVETAVEQNRRKRASALESIFGGGNGPLPVLPIKVHRDRILRDSLTELERAETTDKMTLRLELNVKFAGEEALDMGGVRKEWFQLLVKELMDLNYGMFVCVADNRLWLNMFSETSPADWKLVGIILGLAIYNGVTLDVSFPPVLYAKLHASALGLPFTPKLEDLRDIDPTVYKGLKQLLEMAPETVEAVGQYFEVSFDKYGQMITHELMPGGADIPVTAENREQYVNARVKYLLVESVEKQFNAFSAGFNLLCSNSEAFKMFEPEELEIAIAGSPIVDFDELEKGTIYEPPYSPSTPVIKHLWSILHALPLELQRKFLAFSTGSDRCPPGGLLHLGLVITRNGPDTDMLPTASTCFNHLLLPEYSSKEKLEQKLLQAIQNSTGFGLR